LCVANEDNDSCRECDYYKGVSENYFKSFALIEFRVKLVQSCRQKSKDNAINDK